ncbi:MAG: AtpZ/AtpI family protein [Flavobacteriaceae bacterium]
MSDKKFRLAIKYSGIAIQMALIIVVFNFFGEKLSDRFEKEWIPSLITLLGVFLAMFSVIIQVLKENK